MLLIEHNAFLFLQKNQQSENYSSAKMTQTFFIDSQLQINKMKTKISSALAMLMCIAACTKNSGSAINPPLTPTANYADFLKASEWVGTLDRNGYQYAPPCCLVFTSAKTVTLHAPFRLLISGSYQFIDSINGTVNNIDSLPADGRTRVKITFQHLNDVELFITNRKTLTSTSTDPNKPVPFQAELFPSLGFSVSGTNWTGPLLSGGPLNGFAYPDVSSINFLSNRNTTTHTRNGQVMMVQPTPQIPAPGALEIAYQQKGARVYMMGYKEDDRTLHSYFGVLLPAGNKMMVHSSSQLARLPYYTQTIAWYGPIGVTPIINKY